MKLTYWSNTCNRNVWGFHHHYVDIEVFVKRSIKKIMTSHAQYLEIYLYVIPKYCSKTRIFILHRNPWKLESCELHEKCIYSFFKYIHSGRYALSIHNHTIFFFYYSSFPENKLSHTYQVTYDYGIQYLFIDNNSHQITYFLNIALTPSLQSSKGQVFHFLTTDWRYKVEVIRGI